jgi:HAE1 family hydrophobic/amphiphilic exporter-1
MARAIMGGLAFSSVVSLLIVPMFYVWFDDLNLWRRRVFGRAEASVPAASVAQPSEQPG